MEAKARVTLNDPVLHSRLRREFIKPGYLKRPVQRSQATLLSDVISRQSQKPDRSAAVPVQRPITFESRNNPLTKLPDQSSDFMLKKDSLKVLTTIPGTISKTQTQKVSTRQASKKSKKSKLHLALYMLAACMIIAGGYNSYQGIRNNHLLTLQVAQLTRQANQAALSQVTVSQSESGTNKNSASSTPALSTVKPSAGTLADYTVEPNYPRYIIIPKLSVDARVLSVSVNSKGALETPSNVYDTAWYDESAQPGQQGAMLIDGHVSSWTAHGIFYGIKNLIPGDIIKIQRGDGTVFVYNVVRSQVYQSGNVDMTSAMSPVTPGQPGLNLITCTGDVIPGTSEFNERIVVYATLQ
ncbi:MAG TPA: class F sortase [Candidatus Saccharimonadales bacterium]|jgi:sortase (surface protein transpeptidase)|nr:class F sortase [Candidatus Saccharimonadales bacterium]